MSVVVTETHCSSSLLGGCSQVLIGYNTLSVGRNQVFIAMTVGLCACNRMAGSQQTEPPLLLLVGALLAPFFFPEGHTGWPWTDTIHPSRGFPSTSVQVFFSNRRVSP